MSTDDPCARATNVLKATKYLTLATYDPEGPWAAALAYTLVAPNRMYFVSQTASRHGRAVTDESAVAGVIYNSQASEADVESVQFSGVGRLVKNATRIRELMTAGNGGQEPDETEVARLANDPTVGLFELVVADAYVLDQNAWVEKGIDAREPVAFADAVDGLSRS
jgi:nitroimidazol reductase NimA-like FMN-containing flavoprotein (pyridoxamine 5'-phosphate oxidase superfamily)